jgi:peptidoglycan/LPS O-acetylase OafA/YrhL
MSAANYRPDIDGLRALAVVPVIIFHAGATWLPGGFVGVDIFFVISGYLISSIILREVTAGEFSFVRFYERRLRRIIPALLVVLIVTVAVFQVISLPDQAEDTAKSGIAALLSVSNFYFWRTSGYFSPAVEFMPLVHTWSLAVEEQFYLVFPIALMGIWKLRLPVKWMFALGTLAAFALSYWLSIEMPAVAYYLLPARAWELAIGGVLAAGVVPALKGPAMREAAPALGVGLIVFALFYIRGDMIFPGWVALLPCLGAAMVIHAGGDSWVARNILGARPIVFVGLLSYSLYLWHWPVLTALRIRTANMQLDPPVALGAIAVTFLLAWASWRFVEKPFRNRQAVPERLMLWQVGTASAAVLAVSGLAILMNGFPARLDDSSRMALAASTDIDPLRVRCSTLDERTGCRFGRADGPVTYAIIGDSHAAAIRPGVEASGLMGNAAGTLYWSTSCPMLHDANLLNQPTGAGCASFKAELWTLVKQNRDLIAVVLAGRWPYQITGSFPEAGGSQRAWLVDQESRTRSEDENERVFIRSLGRTLDQLAALNLDVIIIGSIPEPGFDVPHTVALARYNGISAPRGVLRSEVERRAGAADVILARVAAGRPNVRVLSIWDDFCDGKWCQIERNGVPIYSDDDHLSFSGAVEVAAPMITKNVDLHP